VSLPGLRTVQQELKRLIFPGKEPAASALWDGEAPDRLNVYRHNVRGTWLETLDSDFPLTKNQFAETDWSKLRNRFFVKHPPAHWELNKAVEPFVSFLSRERVMPWVKELADYEWNDLAVFIDRSEIRQGAGVSNPSVRVRVYQHQIFNWAEAGAPPDSPPAQKPEVLAFYRDARNVCHVREADPLMLLLLDHFRRSGARLEDAEPVRRKLLPQNQVPLDSVLARLRELDLIL
jgi:hypothetical protein